MAMGLVGDAVATVSGLITGVLNFFTDFFLTPPLNATLMFLEEAELKTLKGGGCGDLLSETPAGQAGGPSVCCGEGGRRNRGPELQTILQRGDFLGRKG
ncbi:hypothetical protein XENOCAPTIV_015389 [Xenoophorus captivus]|uniref:Uncharacterized protein n=1 Tax=Xenoophorus captivus TaxID=1517983 RepID=A0ABV0QVL1_9TELE